MTQQLSLAARSVFESFNSKFDWVEDGVPSPQFKAIAAALRAVADQVVPDDPQEAMYFTTEAIRLNKQAIRRQFLAIAAERPSSQHH
jgi:hypothetical protein